MSTNINIAIDTMGGDHSPEAQLLGAERFIRKRADKNITFQLYGNENLINPIMDKLTLLKEHSTVFHTESAIQPEDKPSVAIRRGRNSSMALAIKSVASGQSNAVVSAGNTGALMAMSKLILKMLPSVDRPAIVTCIPTADNKDCIMLDLGANIECSADHLFQFAVMGNAFARATLNLQDPRIALLNIGSEELKGKDEIKTAADMLRNTSLPLNFTGFVEGNDIVLGKADVIVTDGFTGNIALKSIEGTAQVVKTFLKEALVSSFAAKLGAFLSKNALKQMGKKIDPRRHNGAMFIGLNGISVKSHGSADEIAFYNSLKVTMDLIQYNINQKIIEEMQSYAQQQEELKNNNSVLNA